MIDLNGATGDEKKWNFDTRTMQLWQPGGYRYSKGDDKSSLLCTDCIITIT